MNTYKKGFTLVELLVVISIISFLSSVILASLSTARSKARDTQRIESLHQIQTALELYYNTNGHYPVIPGNFPGYAPASNSPDNGNDPKKWVNGWWGTNFYDAIVGGGYMSSLPVDPSPKACGGWPSAGCHASYYWVSPSGQCYSLGTMPENPVPGNNHSASSWCGNYQIIGGNCTTCTEVTANDGNGLAGSTD